MNKKYLTDNDSGSILIGTIITMVIVSVLGVAMFSMTSSSRLTHVSGKLSKDAFYMAESGFRYAASQIYHAAIDEEGAERDRAQNREAHNIHERTLNLDEGTIEFSVTPFHYVTSNDADAGDESLSVRFPGNNPTGFAIPDQGRLEVAGNLIDYSNFSGNSFTLENSLPQDIPEWTTVTILARPESEQTVTPGSDESALTLENSNPEDGFFMPARNGRFAIRGDPDVYQYDYRVDGNSTTLYGVRRAEDPTDDTLFTVDENDTVIPYNFFKIESRGTVGDASRLLTFIAPVDLVQASGTFDETTSIDTFSDTTVDPGDEESNWEDSAYGSHSVADPDGDGDGALRVTGSDQWGTGGWWGSTYRDSMVTLKHDRFADFRGAWIGNNQTLSYDAQVKMKLPPQDYYMAGLLLRTVHAPNSWTNTSMLGVSLLRRNVDESSSEDDIYDDLVPNGQRGKPLAVLWAKEEGRNPGMDWIAYKNILALHYKNDDDDNFEDGESYDFVRGADSGARASNATPYPFGDSGQGDLDPSSIFGSFENDEDLFIFDYDFTRQRTLSDVSSTRLRYASGVNHGVEAGDIVRGDLSRAIAYVDEVDGRNIYIDDVDGDFRTRDWLMVYRPVSDDPAAQFDYNLSDILCENERRIKDWTTLAVRIEEEVENGVNFNDIRVYIGDTDQHGSPDGSPLDVDRFGNERSGDLKWPPEEGWSSLGSEIVNRDRFTLIQGWRINPDFASSYGLTGTDEEPAAVIRTQEFTTHDLEEFNQQELGLWTAGRGMAGDTYFDDFGVRLKGGIRTGTQTGLATPLMY